VLSQRDEFAVEVIEEEYPWELVHDQRSNVDQQHAQHRTSQLSL
jgi:hypothetical protein